MKVYKISVSHSFAIDYCVVAESMADAEKAYNKVFPDCKVKAIEELYDSVIIAPATGGNE
jgi:hypothetical protein